MRALFPALLFLICTGPTAAEPPDREPQPDCDKLLAAPRPEKAEDAEAWDGCLRGGGVSVVPKTTQGPAPDSEYVLAVGQSLQQGALRVAGFADPFARRATLEPAEGGMVTGDGTPGYTPALYTAERNGVASGGRARLNRGIPPTQRVEEGFQAVSQPDPMALAAQAAERATYPTTFDIVRGWTAETIAAFRPPPMTLEMPAPDYGKAASGPAPRGFVPAGGAPLSTMVGFGVYGAGNEVSKALPYTMFRAGVGEGFIKALGVLPSELKSVTIDYVPGDELGRYQRLSTCVGLKLSPNASLSLSAGFETMPDKKGEPKTVYPGNARLNISF